MCFVFAFYDYYFGFVSLGDLGLLGWVSAYDCLDWGWVLNLGVTGMFCLLISASYLVGFAGLVDLYMVLRGDCVAGLFLGFA